MAASEQRPGPVASWDSLQRAEDGELVREMKAGNDDAFAVIVDRYQRLAFSVAVRIVKDAGEAEDVVQTVFLEIFRKAAQFDPVRGTLKMWLLQYAYSRSMNRRQILERRQFYSQLDLDEIPPSDVPVSRTESSGLAPHESARLVEEALGGLSANQREAIELIYFEGLKFTEAAEKAGISLPALRHHYYRGLTKIRELIETGDPRTQAKASEVVSPAVGLGVINASARSV